MGKRVSIDETALTNGELYTIVTNKDAKGKRGAIIAIIKGTKSSTICAVLRKLPPAKLMAVKEVTLDMGRSMGWIATECFMNAEKVIDRFHVQQLVSDALQEIRIKLRWDAIAEENKLAAEVKKTQNGQGKSGEQGRQKSATPEYENGDTKKQLLARSRYLLFKPGSKWTDSQKERASILFREFPVLKEAYELAMQFRSFYEYSKTRKEGKEKLDAWYEAVKAKTQARQTGKEKGKQTGKRKEEEEEPPFAAFATAMKSIKHHEGRILNYFTNRSTNAAAESFNAKIKSFRALVRGVTDKKFFLFRIAKIYA